MKLNGRKLEKPNIEIIVLPRGQDEDIILKAAAVLDMDSFNKLCPTPKPPKVMKKGGVIVHNVEDPGFQTELQQHSKLRMSYMIVQSLRATEGLEWDTVKYDDPTTWDNYEKELRDSGFAEIEITRIISGVMSANCLNEDKIEEARKRFLAGQEAQQNGQLSLVDVLRST